MALILVNNKICNSCGIDIRPNALFCYSCGSAVASEEKVDENLAEEKSVQIVSPEKEKTAIEETTKTSDDEKPVVSEEIKLKSAASLRRKSKSFQNKKVEIVWEEHENAPNIWFIAVTVVLTIVAGVILYLAVRLK